MNKQCFFRLLFPNIKIFSTICALNHFKDYNPKLKHAELLPLSIERLIKLTFSESLLLSLKTRLLTLLMMTLLNVPQETSNVLLVITS